jgi:hypothetical protein
MSDHDTLPPDSERTSPYHAQFVPQEFDIENSDAPEWAKELFRRVEARRDEERAQLDRIERNQKIQTQEVRRLSGRVRDHDSELGTLRDRIESLEDWRDAVEGKAAE